MTGQHHTINIVKEFFQTQNATLI